MADLVVVDSEGFPEGLSCFFTKEIDEHNIHLLIYWFSDINLKLINAQTSQKSAIDDHEIENN